METVPRPVEFQGCLPVYDHTLEGFMPLAFRVKAYDGSMDSQGEFSNTVSVDVTPGHDGHYTGEIHGGILINGTMDFDVDFNIALGTITINFFPLCLR